MISAEGRVADQEGEEEETRVCSFRRQDWPEWDVEDEEEENTENLNKKINRPYREYNDVCGSGQNDLLLNGKINGEATDILVDTGAAVTLLSEWHACVELGLTLDKIEQCCNLVGVDGLPLDLVGEVLVQIEIGTATCTHVVAVARDLQYQCILGRDVLSAIPCMIQSDGERINFTTSTCKVDIPPRQKIANVVVKRRVVIPAGHEMVVTGKLPRSSGKMLPRVALVERDFKLAKDRGILVAASCVTPDENGNVPVRVLNPSNTPVTLPRKTRLGQLVPLEEIHENGITSTLGTDSEVDEACESEETSKDELWNSLKIDLSALSPQQTVEAKRILNKQRDVFALPGEPLGCTSVMRHKINTGSSTPACQRTRRFPPPQRIEVRKHVEKMLKEGIIEESVSPWSSPVVLVGKPDGTTRFCVDYRKLNSRTVKDPFPLPRIEDTLDALGGAKFFSTLDLCSGFHQLPMSSQDREKTAFTTQDGHFHFTRMPFGVCNGPSSFQRLMTTVLAGLQWEICLVYMDDVIVYGKTFGEHMERLEIVLKRLSDAGLKLKPSKCFFFCPEVNFLGHVVSADGIQVDPRKTSAVLEWPVPTTVKEVQRFLGFCGYYRRFVDGFSEIAAPLYNLTKKNNLFRWSEDHQLAFDTLKKVLTEAPILAFPDYGDNSASFILDVDASSFGLGAVLSQLQNGTERVIAYASRLLRDSEKNYATTKRELLAAVWSINYFRNYLLGRQFTVRTDHKALEHLSSFQTPSAQISRWLEVLSDFDYTIQYRTGAKHSNADGLSRCQEPSLPALAVVDQTSDQFDSCLWRELQEKDSDISVALSWFENGLINAEKPNADHLMGTSRFVRHLWANRQQLEFSDEVLCRRFVSTVAHEPSFLQVVVPKCMRGKILTQYHDESNGGGGHLGIDKTLKKVRQRFHWYGLREDVENWVKSCQSCQSRRRCKPVHRAPLVSVWSGYPFERVAMDLIPALPQTARGNRHALVIVDYFTKWVEAFPLPNMTAEAIAEVYTNNVISRFGAPTSLHTDQGSNFDSNLFRKVCELLGIRKTRTTAYHPAGDGLVERFNQTLEGLLSHLVNSRGNDWDLHLPASLLAYRSSVHKGTGFTPHYLLFGREMTVPADVMYGLPPQHPAFEPAGYVRSLRERLEGAYDLVRRRLAQEHRRQKTTYDRGSNLRSFRVNDLVYVLTPIVQPGCSRKFARFWRGPYTVTGKISDVNYRVQDTAAPYREMVVHIDRLKRCYQRFDRLNVVPELRNETAVMPPTPAEPTSQVGDATAALYDDNVDGEMWNTSPMAAHNQQPAQQRRGRNCGPPARFLDFYM